MNIPIALLLQTLADTPGQPIAPPPKPVVGAMPTVSPDLLVPRPATTPCTVELFAEREFVGDGRQAIAYRPPAACPGPWARIVVEVDFRVTPGRQYDRTNILNLGGVNLFTGTTMEPGATHGPVWHVERDVTEYAALFREGQAGESLLTNYVDATYTGRVFLGTRLVFYPADAANPAPDTPDIVASVAPKLTMLDEKTPEVARDLTFPTNVTRLAIDVLAQPQATDEFWAFCTPDRLRPKGEKIERPCGDPYRETEVTIDGRLVGVAPAFPWIYTGGINPYLWRTTAGVEALNLTPTRVDLTPFAALVNDGKPHRIALKVAGVRHFFFGMGTVLAWRDPVRATVSGAVVRNTLAPAVPQVTGTITGTRRARQGTSSTNVTRRHVAEGWLDTSRGRVTTRIETALDFSNRQQGGIGSGTTEQLTAIEIRTRVIEPGRTAERVERERWPMRFEQKRTGERAVESRSVQSRERTETGLDGVTRSLLREVDTTAAATFGDVGTREGTGHGRVHTLAQDSRTGCLDRTVTVRDFRMTAVTDTVCKGR